MAVQASFGWRRPVSIEELEWRAEKTEDSPGIEHVTSKYLATDSRWFNFGSHCLIIQD